MADRPSRFRPLQTLDATARLLRGRANRHAWVGLGVAGAAIIMATLLVCRYEFDTYSWEGILAVQQRNPALWLLDLMPFLFLVWGQYIGMVMSYQAGALVLDETRDLRQQADRLQYELGRAPVLGHNIGLPNRHALIAAIDRQIAHHQSQLVQGFAVMVLDTVHYQEIEQTHGEEAARQFVTQLRERLQSVITDNDFLAHFGFDDFGVLIADARDAAAGRHHANRIQLALDVPLTIGRRPLSVRTTIGIACYPAHGADAESLLRHAETAKFAAIAGDLDHLVYAPEQDNARSESSRLMAELHSALYNDGLSEEYWVQQPLAADRALRLRLSPVWEHPRLGRLSENHFVDRPDRLGLTHGLSLWILRQGLERLAQWQRLDNAPLLILRLPSSALRLLSLPDLILRMLNAHDLKPAQLIIEFSEAAINPLQAEHRSQLDQLRTAGVKLSLNGIGDLGTSPLAALEVPLDECRIVGKLTLRALDLPKVRSVTQALMQLLKVQAQTVVCSGIETAAQLELAKALQADYAEGTAVAPAMSPDAVTRWLTR
ncbi:EAL domain-containing protein [Sinimarinibacterium sp. CAU 1509]|uniref:EAL domain-containing protein n=1 Tax=Sinimarinibacterium sp. CAU 1509 TaxID=2562283 RepID=UPI0010AC2AED|nr:EAL domain-containing protein [Sinimarinibacterium sp. CAU 1509]TJY62201.1 EAL domain-containing protein [Sinimarinibacterium sp. CAU 1509]